MALTDSCDLYVAVHEDGVNRALRHIMRQRPSWFNYASADIAANRKLWCTSIDFTQDVKTFFNPLFTVMPPLPILGSANPLVLTGFCAQLAKATLDLHPGKSHTLPPELAPPLKEQHFSLHFTACGGLGCATTEELDQLPVGPSPTDQTPGMVAHDRKLPDIVLRTRPICFCLDVFVVGHLAIEAGRLIGKVDGIEIVDIKPEGLEANLECYLRMAVTVVMRQKLAIALRDLALDFPLFGMGTVSLDPTTTPPVAHNPAIEEDQLKVFITMTT